MQMSRRSVAWLLPAYWLACFAATHLPPSAVPSPEIPYVDKAVHFSMFLGLGWLCFLRLKAKELDLLSPSAKATPTKTAALIWCILVAYAAFDESTQPFFGRDAELMDGVADALGAAIGLALQLRTWRHAA